MLSSPLSFSFRVKLCLNLQLSYKFFLSFNISESSFTLFPFFKALRFRSKLVSIIKLHAFFYDLAEALNFFNSLLISFLHLFNYLEWTVLFAKNLEYLIVEAVGLFSLRILFPVHHHLVLGPSFRLLFNLHAIVSSSSTFNMEGDLAARILALHASTFLFKTNDTLELKSLLVNLIETNCALRFKSQTWDPGCATQVNPLILCWHKKHIFFISLFFKVSFISLQEKAVVIWNLTFSL